MQRRTLLTTALALASAGALGSCAAPPREPAGPAGPPEPMPAVAAFAARLMGQLLQPGQNHLHSPASVVLALGLLRPGASGPVAEQLDEVIGADNREGWTAWAHRTIETLRSRTGTFTEADVTRKVTVLVAQAAFAAVGLDLKPEYVTTITEQQGATIGEVDFSRPEQAARVINDWAAEHTEGQIDQIMQPGQIDPRMVLLLANALHLAANWRREMTVEDEATTPFTREDGSVVNVRMMFGDTPGWFSDANVDAALIPFAGERLAMAVALPKTGDWAALLTAWADGGLDAMLAGFDTDQQVALSMPGWRLDWSDSLNQALTAVGLGPLFHAGDDLSGIADAGLSVGQVLHRAVMEVDQYGVVASAVTAIGMITSAPAEPKQLRLDRPFAFVIFDTQTRLPLFIGRLCDPQA